MMLRTYELSRTQKMPLYEQLYRAIRADILAGVLKSGEKLPSKRVLSEHLSVSKITVETAYAQLLAEGYISSRRRSGYFVEAITPITQTAAAQEKPPAAAAPPLQNVRKNTNFPFSVWAKLMRAVLLEQQDALLEPVPHEGLFSLRAAIAEELARLRGMHVSPEQILIGAGAEYFYSQLILFFGRHRLYASEALGHRKIAQVYAANGVRLLPVPMDGEGILPQALAKSGDAVLHITPSHHYPTGTITSVARRQEILKWLAADAGRWVIEDDFDSEFRFSGLPIPTLQSMDTLGRVIYMNTFSKTLTPALRISYMILPQTLLPAWKQMMGIYSCAVPSFEQHTLARFLSEGYFEKHLNRLKKHYRTVRTSLLARLCAPPFSEKITVQTGAAGLQLLLRLKTARSQESVSALVKSVGVEPLFLSDFYVETPPSSAKNCLVVHYADYDEAALTASLAALVAAL